MRLSYRPFLLEFRHPFGVSSNTRTHTPTVFVKLELNGVIGFGEACLPAYLGETTENTIAFFEKAKPVLEQFDHAFEYDRILNAVDALSDSNNAAKAAIDIALFDLAGKMAGKPFYELVGIPKSEARATSATIAIGDKKLIGEKIREASEFHYLKIKAGTDDDKALIQLIRTFTDKPLYVDVNQGWKNKEEAHKMIGWMAEQNVVMIEQPMPLTMSEDMRWLRERSPLPLIADESVKRLKDMEPVKGCFSGINIKLMKCTGMNEAMKMIAKARKENLKIMIGCMAESSCATAAMAQLMQFGDYIDLDAPTLLKNDPFRGVSYKNGKIYLDDRPGFGTEPLIEI